MFFYSVPRDTSMTESKSSAEVRTVLASHAALVVKQQDAPTIFFSFNSPAFCPQTSMSVSSWTMPVKEACGASTTTVDTCAFPRAPSSTSLRRPPLQKPSSRSLPTSLPSRRCLPPTRDSLRPPGPSAAQRDSRPMSKTCAEVRADTPAVTTTRS